MATVYLAIQENFERQVALKVMSPSLSADQNFTERFIREARINSRLVHPNIVTVHDVGVQNGHHYLAMEYIDGHDLKQNLYSITGEQVLQLLSDIALALDYAGQKGYVHRDVKLENIMVRTEDGRAVLMDFGIARAIEGSASETQTGHSLTQSGMSLGTPHYMSPEQVKGLAIDNRSDIYSLGVLFYYLLIKEPPFRAESMFAVGVKHITEEIPQLPEELSVYQPIIERMMAKLPEDRIQTGAEVVSVLDSLDVGPIDDWVEAHQEEFEEEHIRAKTLHDKEVSESLAQSASVSVADQSFSGSVPSSEISESDSSELGTILAPPKSFNVQPQEALHIPREDIVRRGDNASKLPWIIGVSLLLVLAIGGFWFQSQTGSSLSEPELTKQDNLNEGENAELVKNKETNVGDSVKVVEQQPASNSRPAKGRLKDGDTKEKEILSNQSPVENKAEQAEAVSVTSELDDLVLKSEHLNLLVKKDRKKIPELIGVYREILVIDSSQKTAVNGVNRFKKKALAAAEKQLKSANLKNTQRELLAAISLFPELKKDKKYVALYTRLSRDFRIEKLRVEAEKNYDQGKFLAPPGDNAEEGFRKILAIDANNRSAKLGLEKIVGRFTALAKTAKDQKKYDQSMGFVNNGLRVDDDNEILQSLRRELQALMTEDQKIDQLLASAAEFESQEVWFGSGMSAAHSYQEVLAIDDSNLVALEGLAQVKSTGFSLLNDLILEKNFELAQSTLQAALISFPNDETLIGIRMELEENRPTIESLIVSGRPSSDKENAVQPLNIVVDRTLYFVLNYRGFEQAATVMQVILWDGGRSVQMAAKPIVLTGNSGSYPFSIDRAVEGFTEGGYHIDILLAGKEVYSHGFVISH